jgi:putative iron-only hydrogenase system regulator
VSGACGEEGKTYHELTPKSGLRRKAGTAHPLRVRSMDHAFRHGFFFSAERSLMESRIAAISILVEGSESVETLNAILHDYAPYILGRLGIPYREKGLSVICLVLDAPMDTINALTGKLGRLSGVSAKAVTPRSAK